MEAPSSCTLERNRRIVELDALRGLAIVGIAWMNVYVFALPAQAYYNPVAWGYEGVLDLAVWAASFVFIEDKFRTLFAMLFGVGVAMLLEKNRERGLRHHMARMLALFVIGIIHATLLASNDILRGYAMAGVLLPLFIRLQPMALLASAGALLAVHIAGGYFWAVGQPPEFWTLNFGNAPSGLDVTLAMGAESFGDRIDRRFWTMPGSLAVIAAGIPLNLATMLVGVAAWKSGMLRSHWQTRRLLSLAAISSAVAIPALMLLAWQASSSQMQADVVATNALIRSAPFDLLLGVAYAAIAMATLRAIKASAAARYLAAVGRLSLTNYLMTSVIFASLFASWGLGWFASVSRTEAFSLSFVPIVAMLVWSPVLLMRFGQGPFENLWRRAAQALS